MDITGLAEAYEEVSTQDEQTLVCQEVHQALSVLNPRERLVISRYFGLDGVSTPNYAAIGRGMDLSRGRVRQLFKSALQKLRHEPALQSLCPAYAEIAEANGWDWYGDEDSYGVAEAGVCSG
jgi:DNA-directed RNA polymerase sigma subunit (sigma70/sigma32)